MDETGDTAVFNTDASNHKILGIPNLTSSALFSFVSNFPKKVSECIDKHFKPLERDGYSTMFKSYTRINKMVSPAELNSENQLHAWKENPVWVDDPPEIIVRNTALDGGCTIHCTEEKFTFEVTVPKGSLCNLDLSVNVGLPPDAVYNIVTDPDNKRVFKNIKEVISRKVLVEEGSRQVVEVEQAAIWKFLWFSGILSVHVLVDQNREDHTMKFKQIKSGFMERFEGCWKMEPIYVDQALCHPFKPNSLAEYITCTKGRGRIGSKLILQQLIQPSIIPPPPISWYVRGITTKTTEMLINDLLAEAARIRQASMAENTDPSGGQMGKYQVDECNIKERWARRRRNGRRCRKRFSSS